MPSRTPDAVPDGEQPAADPAPAPSSEPAFIAWGKARAASGQRKADELLGRHRDRPLVDVALRIYERDRETAGSVVGSALAFRLFLFFVPLLLFVVGLAGFLSAHVGSGDVADAGIAGNLAHQINDALTQPTSTRWIATIVGLFGMITTGRTLSKVMAVASCLSWQMPVRAKASVRAIGGTVGLVVGVGVVSTIINKIRHELGIGAAGISFLGAVALYTVAWILLFVLLPRATADPGVLLPGALLVGLTLTGLQAVSQLYLPSRLSRASELYGAMGSVIVTLGWFFIVGRAIVLALSLNAVVFERFGSISTFVFGLPVLRILPRRWAWIRRFFQLDE
ncbi:MAG: YhjD/YihY/BrkB family envelope integrity protein [Ilumatobacteraceae bacterium]